jgi:hypothetical protein
MARTTEKTRQTAVRLPEDWFARLDVIAEKLARPGIPVSQADAIRAAMARGLDALEAEYGIKAKETPTKAKREK